MARKQRNKKIDNERLKNAFRPFCENEIVFKDFTTLPGDALVDLKQAVSPINNYITARLTTQFINTLPQLFPNAGIDVAPLLEEFGVIPDDDEESSGSNTNANGFDFVKDFGNDLKVVAEVKANRPYEGNKFGAAQIEGIKKDITGMIEGKTKSHLTEEKLKDYYKFQVMMKYVKGEYSTTNAINALFKKANFKVGLVRNAPIEDMTGKDKDKVYIIQIELQ